MADSWVFDHASESSGTALDVSASPYMVMEFASPAPGLDTVSASGIDVEGVVVTARGDQTRQVQMTVRVDPSTRTQPNLDAAVATLEKKIAKLRREGGTLRKIRPDATYKTLDILAADGLDKAFDVTYDANVAVCQISLLAAPFARGAAVTLSSHSETTLPVLVFTETGIAGDVPATGRLVVSEASAVDQWWLTWGVESKNYSSASTAALFYEAEGRTALGTAANTVVAGSSGGSVVRHSNLSGSATPILSTQATGGGAHLTHVGTYRVWANVTPGASNGGSTSVYLKWGTGDFRRFTDNPAVTYDTGSNGIKRLADLGIVRLPAVLSGTQRWEGRIFASSTVAGDDLDIDWLMLVPVAEGSGEATASSVTSVVASYTASDDFDQAAGALNAKTLPVGGTWATSGGATDFAVSGSGTVTRSTAVSETFPGGGRFALAGTATPSNVVVHSAFVYLFQVSRIGVVARYVDSSNYLLGLLRPALVASGYPTLAVYKVIAGTATLIGSIPATFTSAGVTLSVFATGAFVLEGAGKRVAGSDSALATGGTLAAGKVGIFDCNTTVFADTRTYYNFNAYVPATDAAMFASQSLEVRSTGVIREDSTGTIWSDVSRYEGDYLHIPPAGPEGRTARFIVKASRNVPSVGADSGIDDISAQLIYTPRYLNVT